MVALFLKRTKIRMITTEECLSLGPRRCPMMTMELGTRTRFSLRKRRLAAILYVLSKMSSCIFRLLPINRRITKILREQTEKTASLTKRRTRAFRILKLVRKEEFAHLVEKFCLVGSFESWFRTGSKVQRATSAKRARRSGIRGSYC